MTKEKQKNILLIILILLFMGQFFFISPQGEFALNDDWVHTDTIRGWVDTGDFRLMPYAGPTFYVPILYGASLSKVFGFSFTLLRISTLVITLLLLLVFYLFLNKITHKPGLSFLGTLALWFNPITYNLSFTFMTDVPALLLLLLAIYSYYLAFTTKKPGWLFWGSVLAVIGFFTRQTNILILVAAGLFALKDIKNFKFKNLVWSFGIPLAIGGIVYSWLTVYQLLPQSTTSHFIEGTGRLLGHMKWWIWYTPMYLGLFLFPLTAGWLTAHKRGWKNGKLWILFILLGGLAVLIRQVWHLQFPYIGNIISIYGLGPTKGVIAGELKLLAPSWVWGVMTIIAAFGLSLLLTILSHRRTNGQPTGFIYLFGILYFIPILLFESFDRYFLPLIVVVIIALLQNLKHLKFSHLTATLVLVVLAIISITQTHHYLEWNSARWELANSVLEKNIPANTIDGGYEWDGWNGYWSAVESGKQNGAETAPWWIYHLFVNNTEEYIVSFSAFNGYETIDTRQINSIGPNNAMYLLKKSTREDNY